MTEYFQCEECKKSVKIIDRGPGQLSCCGKPMHMIDHFESSGEILDFAITREQEAHDFYMYWAGKLKYANVKQVLQEFAQDEFKHKKLLVAVKNGKKLKPSSKQIEDMKIADYLVDVTPSPDMDYQKVLIVAMKREKTAFKLYTDLAAMTDDENLSTTFQTLAQEEAKHKLRIETLYEKDVLTWD